MSNYINKAEVRIAEIARINFYEVLDADKDPVGDLIVDLSMHPECLRNIHAVIGQVLAEHDKKMKEQAEVNKKMN